MEPHMATRNVVLTAPQSDLVHRLVASGRYQNASEALRAGLRLPERAENELSALRDRLSMVFMRPAGLISLRARARTLSVVL
jgi:putative addiction module CopG family antidote